MDTVHMLGQMTLCCVIVAALCFIRCLPEFWGSTYLDASSTPQTVATKMSDTDKCPLGWQTAPPGGFLLCAKKS